MGEAVRLADRVAGTDANVLITGESGVGKDALAFYVHSKSSRAAQSFVKIDCATLPSGLLEAELFGYERGAFTGASEEKPGRLEASHRGTLVLDEIAYLSTDSLKRQQFREDLYYRLHVLHIKVPPLRERKEDLAQLARFFVRSYAAKHGRDVTDVSAEALSLLGEYEFPGNVRELANIIERAVIVSSSERIEIEHLPEPIRANVLGQRRRQQPQSLAEVEAEYVAEILALTKGNKTEAARILGISRKNLYEKLARRKKDESGSGRMKEETNG